MIRFRRRRCLAVFAAAALAVAMAASGAVAAGPQPLDSRAYPYSAIGRLNAAGEGFCTATLVGPDLVLTAAHCLWDRIRGRWRPVDDVHFVAGYQRSTWLAHGRAVKVIMDRPRTAPGKDHIGQAADDWALVRLDTPIGERVGWLGMVPGAALAQVPAADVAVTAYRHDRAHLLSVQSGCNAALAAAPENRRVIVHRCDVVHGASGSPLVVREAGGGWTVLGVNAMRAEGSSSGIRAVAAPLDPALARLGVDRVDGAAR